MSIWPNLKYFSLLSEGWNNMFTDVFFQNPGQKLAELASKHVDVYNYVFTHKSNTTLCQIYGLPDNNLAPIHGDEILFQFAPEKLGMFPDGITLSEEVKIYKYYEFLNINIILLGCFGTD